jgi:mono/diheme cytochrome c family protein
MQVAAQGSGDALLDLGRSVYSENCEACHQPSGEGVPPSFPALDGNPAVADGAFVARQVRAGKEAMPAFPDLSTEEIAAVATYIRNAWSNAYGPFSVAEAEDALKDVSVQVASRSIWDGVYTASQASDARLYYLGACAPCHGSRLNGAPDDGDMSPAPPLAGQAFMRSWGGRSLAALFEYTRTTMPIRNPGQFEDEQYIDIIAYMLSYADVPPGSEKLTPDIGALSDILIEPAPDPEPE